VTELLRVQMCIACCGGADLYGRKGRICGLFDLFLFPIEIRLFGTLL